METQEIKNFDSTTRNVWRLLFIMGMSACMHSVAQEPVPTDIRVNQVGYYPREKKIAVVVGEGRKDFYIETVPGSRQVFQGVLSAAVQSTFSSRKSQVADFSSLTDTGTYVLIVPGLGKSWPFEIRHNVLAEAARASLKAFYFQRFSTALAPGFAGKWSRPFCHPDDRVLIHASAADDKRREGTVIASPRGWMDAGDYNKYVVNSGISTATLLSAYEDYGTHYRSLNLVIPESSNTLPDILDETLWNLRWMLTMQDPNDGGVYHKCTNANFDPMVMPDRATTPRYVVRKSTAAALNLAAVCAQAARVFRMFDKELPGLADSCLVAAQRAWQWARSHPDERYEQEKINAQFDPDITTGAYGDSDVSDEFVWAACELTATTGDNAYVKSVSLINEEPLRVPSWNQVKLLGYYTLVRHEEKLKGVLKNEIPTVRERLVGKANEMITGVEKREFRTVMGGNLRDFVWGSNAVAANQAILLLTAFKISGNRAFYEYAIGQADYLLGRNATGYSFLTGYGDRTPMHPHHRPSEADGVADPVPGLLAGGPNPGMQDKCKYPSSVPDEAYVDDACSYASNEIAINWNAPCAYLLGALEALQAR
ncbi:MAG TPA: glycoside hydrolase family 9 protein [Chryseosolibacter sp.]|nr:glycoside hydrolase family 9 protein [Chryseosolibacter sp.]